MAKAKIRINEMVKRKSILACALATLETGCALLNQCADFENECADDNDADNNAYALYNAIKSIELIRKQIKGRDFVHEANVI